MPGTPGNDKRTDETVEDSFPASDPPSQTPAAGVGDGGGDAHADEAKGLPHSDRHATETAAGRTEERRPAEHKH